MLGSRFTSTAAALALVVAGPFQPIALAQQPQAVTATRDFDRYDVGAAAANVLWIPFKVGVCGISAGVGALAFILTIGAARGWTESAFDEGCAHNWLLTGANFRPIAPVEEFGETPRPGALGR